MDRIIRVSLRSGLLIGVILCAVACSKKRDGISETKPAPLVLDMPTIPSVLTDESLRREYLAEHYWDRFAFENSTWVSDTAAFEGVLANYIALLQRVPLPIAQKSLGAMMEQVLEKGDSTMIAHFLSRADHYLYDPNSPMRNEEFFIPLLQVVTQSAKVDDIQKIRPMAQLKLAMKNRLGEKSTDFSFQLSNGAKQSLFGVKAGYTLLFFYNLGCHACQEVRESLLGGGIDRIDNLKVIAIYPDEDFTGWKEQQGKIPEQWINGFDPQQVLNKKQLYDLKAIPTLYLLGRDKRVLLKDATVDQVLDYLSRR